MADHLRSVLQLQPGQDVALNAFLDALKPPGDEPRTTWAAARRDAAHDRRPSGSTAWLRALDEQRTRMLATHRRHQAVLRPADARPAEGVRRPRADADASRRPWPRHGWSRGRSWRLAAMSRATTEWERTARLAADRPVPAWAACPLPPRPLTPGHVHGAGQSAPVHGVLALGRAVVAALAAVALIAPGLWLGLAAPPDYQQGTTVRIMFVHVPAAHDRECAYACLGGASFFSLVFRHALADAAARAAAPLGAAFTLLALVTGSLWGRPMWGAWWVWDARLTSVLVLFLLFLGYMALRVGDRRRGQGRRAPRRSWRWSAWSTCRSSSSRSTGGTACTRASRSSAPAARPSPPVFLIPLGLMSRRLPRRLRRAVAGAHPRRGLAPARAEPRGAGGRPKLTREHDKYALFVWPAYAVTALAFAWMVLDTLLRARAWRRRAERLEAERPDPTATP